MNVGDNPYQYFDTVLPLYTMEFSSVFFDTPTYILIFTLILLACLFSNTIYHVYPYNGHFWPFYLSSTFSKMGEMWPKKFYKVFVLPLNHTYNRSIYPGVRGIAYFRSPASRDAELQKNFWMYFLAYSLKIFCNFNFLKWKNNTGVTK